CPRAAPPSTPRHLRRIRFRRRQRSSKRSRGSERKNTRCRTSRRTCRRAVGRLTKLRRPRTRFPKQPPRHGKRLASLIKKGSCKRSRRDRFVHRETYWAASVHSTHGPASRSPRKRCNWNLLRRLRNLQVAAHAPNDTTRRPHHGR